MENRSVLYGFFEDCWINQHNKLAQKISDSAQVTSRYGCIVSKIHIYLLDIHGIADSC
ncbi:hypothetical protein P8845_12030 [Bacillus spizizenii]|nr:hypothetical protein [Bacillus spizizenii]MEC0611285.1 hypothetical protein [Bacillus spizizenii]